MKTQHLLASLSVLILAASIPSSVALAEFDNITDSVGVVRQAGGSSPLVWIFEEDHGQIDGQLQEAIMLIRLRRHYSVNDIALEGYLPEQQEDVESYLGRMQSVVN